MKRTLSLILALLTVFSASSFTVCAAEPQPLLVYDLLKYDTDSASDVCRTVEVYFQRQMRNLDRTKQITFRTADDTVVAVCVPYADNNRKYDLYTPDGRFGVVLDPARLYFLTIPQGAYFTDDGIVCAAYRGEYNGVYLTSNDAAYTVCDLGVSEFLATSFKDKQLFSGRISVNPVFTTQRYTESAVTLYRKDGDGYEKVRVCTVVSMKKNSVDLGFGGVEIDQYASYKLHVDYGAFTDGKRTVNGHSDYVLSGKKLLGKRETYPAVDLLIGWFGADHWTLKAVTTVLDVLSKIKLVDKALAKDVKDYISAKKSA